MVPRYLTLYQLPVLLRYSVRLRMDNGCIFLFLRGLLTSLSEEIAESSRYCHQENDHTSNKPSHYGIYCW